MQVHVGSPAHENASTGALPTTWDRQVSGVLGMADDDDNGGNVDTDDGDGELEQFDIGARPQTRMLLVQVRSRWTCACGVFADHV